VTTEASKQSAGRRWLKRIIPVLVSLGTLAWLFAYGGIDFRNVMDAINLKVALTLVPALIVYGVFALFLEAKSILWLVESPPEDFDTWTAARIKSASYLLAVINYALGIAALTVLLRRRAKLSLGASASVVLLASSIDVVVVLLFAALGATAMALDFQDQQESIVIATVTVLSAFLGGAALLRAPGSLGPFERLRSLSVFNALRTAPLDRLLWVTLMRVAFAISFVLVSGVSFAAFDIHPSIGQLVAGMMVVAVVSALPIAVGGLGTSQWAMITAFGNVADSNTLVAMSLVLSAGIILLRIGMGMLFAREFTREALSDSRTHEA
jgi:uncharacterized membrane protein YbhN (UPF0104 family)